MWCIIYKFQNPGHLINALIGGAKYRTGDFSYIRSLISIYYASTRAESYSTSEYQNINGSGTNLSSSDTKRDAFRHVLWSSLLARYYWTVTSKSKRLQFAEAVGNANEECGENNDDGMYMDFHNNKIGRELFNQNSSYKTKKVLWWRVTYGLNLPSTSSLVSITRTKVNSAKFINPDTYTSIPTRVEQIENTDDSQVVYISDITIAN